MSHIKTEVVVKVDRNHENQVIELCGQVGKILLVNGAEIPRVEETVEYIGHSAGVAISCYVTLTAIFISVDTEPMTHVVKTNPGSFNLQKVDEINELSREFVAQEIGFDELSRHVAQVDRKVIDFNWPSKIIGAGLVSVAPMLLFRTAWSDLAMAFWIGIVGYLAAMYVKKIAAIPFIGEVVGGFSVALLALLVVHFGWANNSNNIIISALMPLVPGVPITNAFREIIAGHLISGVMRTINALLVAGFIGSGVILAGLLFRAVFGV